METVITTIDSLPTWVTAITVAVTGLTAITTLTPNKSDNVYMDTALRLLNVLAGNVGKNKNT